MWLAQVSGGSTPLISLLWVRDILLSPFHAYPYLGVLAVVGAKLNRPIPHFTSLLSLAVLTVCLGNVAFGSPAPSHTLTLTYVGKVVKCFGGGI